MKIIKVRASPMSDPVPPERRHRTDLGTKMKSDATLILVETDNGLTGMGAALGTPPVIVLVQIPRPSAVGADAEMVVHQVVAEVAGVVPQPIGKTATG